MDEAARDLLKVVRHSIEYGEVRARIKFVFSNREPGESVASDSFLQLARDYGVPLGCFSSKKLGADNQATSAPGSILPEWCIDCDKDVMARLAPFHPDLCLLTGYMLIVGPELHYDKPSPRPAWRPTLLLTGGYLAAYGGQSRHNRGHDAPGYARTGQAAPPMTFCTCSLRGEPFDRYWGEIAASSLKEILLRDGEDNRLFKVIRRHGLPREFLLIVATIKAFSEARVTVRNGEILDCPGKPVQACNLTEEIDRTIGYTVSGQL
ncbi:MAG: hypothetical protein ABIH46_04965 [Chloroflexota bacterium]